MAGKIRRDGRFGENRRRRARERHGDRCECRPLLAGRRPSLPIRNSHSSLTHMIYQLSRFPRAARLIHGLKCMMHVAAYDRRINVHAPKSCLYLHQRKLNNL